MQPTKRRPVVTQQGFSMVELMIAILIIVILLGIAIPTIQTSIQSQRLPGAAKGVAGQLALARLRAAANFTQARLNFNSIANTYQLELKSSGSFQIEGSAQPIPQGVTFGFGSITTPPTGCQSTIAQSMQIPFNSRGIPMDSFNNPVGTSAIYLGDNLGHYAAVCVSLSGRVKVWRYTGGSPPWQAF